MDAFNYFFNTRRFREGSFKESFQEGLFASLKKYQKALQEAEELRKEFDRELSDYDLWITPVAATSAIPHQPTGTGQILHSKEVPYTSYIGNFMMATALFHHPILVAPLKYSKGDFPIGVQIHGKRGKDWQLMADSKVLAVGDNYGQIKD